MLKAKLANTFPLLEEGAHSPVLPSPISPALVQKRIEWLFRCKQASHQDFTLLLMLAEPADSFHSTLAAVLALKDKAALNRLLVLERAVSAKKVTARWSQLKALYRYYGIDVVKTKDDLYMIKFAHEEGHGEPVELSKLDTALAQSAFPSATDPNRYSGVHVPDKVCQVARRALEGKQGLK